MAKEKKSKSGQETEAELAKVQEELAKVNEDLAVAHNDYLKLLAEFNTFRQRTKDERDSIISGAATDIIKGMLPVLDDCERAMALLETSKDEAAKEGTRLIYDKLFGYLKSKGLEKIEAKGKAFDTDFHEAEALIPVDDEDKNGIVFDVIQTGYTLDGKILRYAKVVVGQKKS